MRIITLLLIAKLLVAGAAVADQRDATENSVDSPDVAAEDSAAISDLNVEEQLVELLEELQATRRQAEAAAEREAAAAKRLKELGARLAELEANRKAREAAEAQRARASLAPESAEGLVTAVDGRRHSLRVNSNLRAGPGLDQAVLEVLPSGTMVQVFGAAGDWVRIGTPAGQTGWLYEGLLGPDLDGG